jgi:hypothetical protein
LLEEGRWRGGDVPAGVRGPRGVLSRLAPPTAKGTADVGLRVAGEPPGGAMWRVNDRPSLGGVPGWGNAATTGGGAR